jgi:hypothetical protein
MTVTTKDSLPDVKDVTSAEYVPVPAGNQPQPLSVNVILSGLGGQYTPEKDGDKVVPLQGYVPEGNRDGVDDKALVRDKAFRLHQIDTEGELGNYPRIVDPRDNDDAPDEWPASRKK